MQKKEYFIENVKRENETYNVILEAIEVLKPIAKKFDGKVINKRFVDAVNKEFEAKGLKVPVNFRKQRLYINVDGYNRVYFITNHPSLITIYPEKYDKPYIADKRMNYGIFEAAVTKSIAYISSNISDNEACIESVDEIIKKYAELKEYVRNFMDSMPYKFKTFPIIECPVY